MQQVLPCSPAWMRPCWACTPLTSTLRIAVQSCCAAVVFWGGPLWQVYIGLRTHACTVSVKGLRAATAAEIERMHNDCAICWMAMTVPGAAQHGTAAPEDRPPSAAPAPAAAPDDALLLLPAAATATAGAVADPQNEAPLPAAAGTGGVVGAARHAPAEDLGDSDGSTLPCGHCYHQTCLTQVGTCLVDWPTVCRLSLTAQAAALLRLHFHHMVACSWWACHGPFQEVTRSL